MQRRRFWRHYGWWLVILCLVCLLTVAGWLLWQSQKPVRLQWTEVSKHNLSNAIMESGTVKPVQRQLVFLNQLPGPIENTYVHPGEVVKKGQALFTSGGVSWPASITGQVLFVHPQGVDSSGQPEPVIEVASLQKQIVIEVSEENAVHVHAGQRVLLTADAYPGQTWRGTVISVAPYAAENLNGSSQVEVDIKPHTPFTIPYGFTVHAEWNTVIAQHVLTIPYSALVQDGTQYAVFVYQNHRVQEKIVSLGQTDNSLVQVLSGLSDGQKIVNNPPSSLQSGEVVVQP